MNLFRVPDQEHTKREGSSKMEVEKKKETFFCLMTLEFLNLFLCLLHGILFVILKYLKGRKMKKKKKKNLQIVRKHDNDVETNNNNNKNR